MNAAEDIRDRIITEARSWMNTPFAHQQRVKGVGVDCVNFLAEVALATGALPDAKFERNYRKRETGEKLVELICDYCCLVFNAPGPAYDPAKLRRADVLALCDEALREPNRPRHLILVTDFQKYLKGIHASARGVKEHRLDLRFTRRIHSVWRLPAVVEADGESPWMFSGRVLFDLKPEDV